MNETKAPRTQAERDRAEGVDGPMREAIQRAKRLQITKATGCCQICSFPVVLWTQADLEVGRTCHVCRFAQLLAFMAWRPPA